MECFHKVILLYFYFVLLSISHRRQAAYLAWAKANDFTSMLPKDSKAQREKAKADAQTTLDTHLEMPVKKHVVPYSDALFRQIAIGWLVSTDQVCSALLCWCLHSV